MTAYCLYAGPKGVAQILALTATISGSEASARMNLPTGVGSMVVMGRAERQTSWHNTPNTGLTVILGGFLEIIVNKATPVTTTLGAGDMLFVLDSTGEGHCSRGYGPDGLSALLLPLKGEDLSRLSDSFTNWPAL